MNGWMDYVPFSLKWKCEYRVIFTIKSFSGKEKLCVSKLLAKKKNITAAFVIKLVVMKSIKLFQSLIFSSRCFGWCLTLTDLSMYLLCWREELWGGAAYRDTRKLMTHQCFSPIRIRAHVRVTRSCCASKIAKINNQLFYYFAILLQMQWIFQP